MELLSIVIPTFNRGAILSETLRTLVVASSGLNPQIIVVDDSKTSEVESKIPGIRILKNPGSGAASARNFGARHATGTLLLFMDDDVLVSRRSIDRTLELHREYGDCCLNLNWRYSDEMIRQLGTTSFGRFIREVGLVDYRGCVPDLPWQRTGTFEVPKVTALFFSMRRTSFDAVGGFDEAFKNQGVEDDEFSKRLHKSGRRMFLDSTEFVIHNELDRIELTSRLNRLQVGALNKRQALEMGMGEYRLDLPRHKIVAYSFLSRLKRVLVALAETVPNTPAFDGVYSRIVHTLIGTVVFEGYYKRDRRLLAQSGEN